MSVTFSWAERPLYRAHYFQSLFGSPPHKIVIFSGSIYKGIWGMRAVYRVSALYIVGLKNKAQLKEKEGQSSFIRPHLSVVESLPGQDSISHPSRIMRPILRLICELSNIPAPIPAARILIFRSHFQHRISLSINFIIDFALYFRTFSITIEKINSK